MNWQSIQIEGALISADLLTEIYNGTAIGQKASDFSLNGKLRLVDEIAASWSDARAYWEAFQHGLRRIKADETGATVTREQWILPLLRTLGFEDITFSRSAAQVGGLSYFISHRLGNDQEGLPIHIEGANVDLDRRPPSGRPRISPHALVQEYLNRTEHLWAILTNGYQLRILRDAARLSRPTYLQFDLREIMSGEHFTDFSILYKLIHHTRWPGSIDAIHECLLEQYYQIGIESGGRVREKLRDGVEAAIKIFGNGFLAHPANEHLRNKLHSNELQTLDYYRQLLRLVYRFLFLMVSEERNLVGPDPENDTLYRIYTENYSISRLRSKVERPLDPEERHWDLWEAVKQNFHLYCDERQGAILGVTALNGDLFGPRAIPDLEETNLFNRDFLRGFAHISLFKDSKTTRRINYAHLDVEELGSVYESLLDYHPDIRERNGQMTFDLVFGTERKSTGSYYTRPELVNELVKSALVPVMEKRIAAAQTRKDKIAALLSMKVCDPAAGSGHFLLAASRRMARELAKLRSGEEEPTPAQFRRAMRDIIRHCIYGVDINPLAVDLCKVALWLEGHNRGMPLTFLDHRIKCGNSLVGIDTLERLREGIPDDAFKPVTGDDREVAKEIRARNRRERKERESGQYRLAFEGFEEQLEKDLGTFARKIRQIDALREQQAGDVSRKQQLYEQTRSERSWYHDWRAANLWTAAFFYPVQDAADPAIPTHERLLRFLEQPGAAHGQLVGKADAMAQELRFFHWTLEFPEVFAAPENAGGQNTGFDVVLGNPPWEQIQPEEQKFFTIFAPDIAKLPGARRKTAIDELPEKNPSLFSIWKNYQKEVDSFSKFVRESKRFVLTAVGKLNTYSLFSELSKSLLKPSGRAGIIVPIGIATDNSTKQFFSELVESQTLISLIGFENEAFIFPSVHHSYKFCAFTLAGKSIEIEKIDFVFFCRTFEQVDQEERHFNISSDEIALLNPNTKTCPIFRTAIDAELTKKIYRNVPAFINETTGNNLWGVTFKQGLFNMTSDSHLFSSNHSPGQVSLYEAKMMHHFDHRYATYEGATQANLNAGILPQTTEEQKQDPHFAVLPRYWVSKEVVEERLSRWERGWLLGFRDVTSSVVERTAIFSILPRVGVGHKIPLMLFNEIEKPKLRGCFLANVNSMVFDYVTRQKVGGTSLSYFILKQLPVLLPDTYSQSDIEFITPRVLELVYTSWDMQPFAMDMGYAGEPFVWNEERRAQLRAELDAYYAKLYGLDRDELEYILDPHAVFGKDFPGETFRVLKEKEIKKYGEYRTRRLVLAAWDQFFRFHDDEATAFMGKTGEAFVPDLVLSTPSTHSEQQSTTAKITQKPHAGNWRFNQAAVIAYLVKQNEQDQHFGRTKLVKELYFIQEHLGIDLKLNPVRQAAGPLDIEIYNMESLAQTRKWIRSKKTRKKVQYLVGSNVHEGIKQAEKIFGNHKTEIDNLIEFFGSYKTKTIERWATVHKAWKDLSGTGNKVSKSDLINEVKEWKPEKWGFSEIEINRTIEGLVKFGFIDSE